MVAKQTRLIELSSIQNATSVIVDTTSDVRRSSGNVDHNEDRPFLGIDRALYLVGLLSCFASSFLYIMITCVPQMHFWGPENRIFSRPCCKRFQFWGLHNLIHFVHLCAFRSAYRLASDQPRTDRPHLGGRSPGVLFNAAITPQLLFFIFHYMCIMYLWLPHSSTY